MSPHYMLLQIAFEDEAEAACLASALMSRRLPGLMTQQMFEVDSLAYDIEHSQAIRTKQLVC